MQALKAAQNLSNLCDLSNESLMCKLGLGKMRVSDPRNCVYFCVFRMSAPGAYHVPLIVVEQYGGLYEVLQGGAHLFEREVRL